MKPTMMSKKAMDHLFDHILDGHASSHQGIVNLEKQGLVPEEQIRDLLKQNNERLIDRIKEFKLVYKLVCIFFALMFGYMQVSGDDIERARRSRKGRGRRKNEYEMIDEL
jgi:hypothetical protein